MIAVVAAMGTLFLWALVAGRLARWNVTAPVAMVLAGVALTRGSHPVVRISLTTSTAEHAVEIVLAIMLFVDSTEVPRGTIGREPRLMTRLLAIALPLTLGAAVLTGYLLFPGRQLRLLAVLATVVAPIDLAPVTAMIRDSRVPGWLRGVLNVESGLNDGIVAPLFLLSLASAEAHGQGTPPADTVVGAFHALLWAVASGAITGYPGAWLLHRAWTKGWSRRSALRLGMVALPLMSYALAVDLHGNGFVAAFVAGLCFNSAARDLPEDVMHLVEDTATLLSLGVWFVFGLAVNQAFADGLSFRVLLYALLSLTVVRAVPVLLCLLGTRVSRQDRAFLAWLGPRGLASIVFGLLAFIGLSPASTASADLVAQVMVLTVLLSLLLHGPGYGPLAAAYARARKRLSEHAP